MENKMRLFENVYALKTPLAGYTDKIEVWRDYIWSTTPPVANDVQHHWDMVHANGHTVLDFTTHEIPARPDSELRAKIVKTLQDWQPV